MRRAAGKKTLGSHEAADPGATYAYAVRLLARRDHSVSELRRKLLDRGYLQNVVEGVLARLEASKSLNDQRYTENVVAYRARRGQGPARIRNELRRSGVDPEAIDSAIKTDVDAPNFVALAREARRRKFGAELPKDWKERSRQARFLQYRGFSTDHIRAVLQGVDEDTLAGGEPDPT
jgi:regulatory protein